MIPADDTSQYRIIGAGNYGLTTAKDLKQPGVPSSVFEHEDCTEDRQAQLVVRMAV